jgi:hypothetical protein
VDALETYGFHLLILVPLINSPALTLQTTKVKETVTQYVLVVDFFHATGRHRDDNYGFQIHS